MTSIAARGRIIYRNNVWPITNCIYRYVSFTMLLFLCISTPGKSHCGELCLSSIEIAWSSVHHNRKMSPRFRTPIMIARTPYHVRSRSTRASFLGKKRHVHLPTADFSDTPKQAGAGVLSHYTTTLKTPGDRRLDTYSTQGYRWVVHSEAITKRPNIWGASL